MSCFNYRHFQNGFVMGLWCPQRSSLTGGSLITRSSVKMEYHLRILSPHHSIDVRITELYAWHRLCLVQTSLHRQRGVHGCRGFRPHQSLSSLNTARWDNEVDLELWHGYWIRYHYLGFRAKNLSTKWNYKITDWEPTVDHRLHKLVLFR